MYIFISITVILLLIIWNYNSLIQKKAQLENAKSSVNVALKKRYDLLPNLVKNLKESNLQETEVLDKLLDLKDSININLLNSERFELENKLEQLSCSIYKSFISNKIQSSNTTIHLQKTWNEMEEQISAARRFYNTSVTEYNLKIQVFPSNIMASFLKYEREDTFQITQKEGISPNAEELFKNK